MTANNKLYFAIFKSMVGRYSVYGVNLLSMAFFARVFSPEHYGVIASVMVFYVFFQLIAEVGLGPAIINVDGLQSEDRDGLFGLTIFVGLLFSIFFYLSSALIVDFYGEAAIAVVVPYISLGLFFYTASVLPTALLLRSQRFFLLAAAGLIGEMMSSLGCYLLLNYVQALNALAAKASISATFQFLVLYFFSKYSDIGRPKLGLNFSAIKPLLAFTSYQFGFNVVNYFSRNLDNILVAKYMGVNTLGVYDKAYQLMRYPLMLLTYSMTPAIQPVLREHAKEPAKVEEIYRKFCFRLSLLGAISGVFVYFLADWIVLVILGNNWLDVVPIIRILAISIPVQVVLSTSGSVFQALNRSDILFACGLFGAFTVVTSIVFGVYQRDINILCFGIVVAYHVNFVQAYIALYGKVFKLSSRSFFTSMVPVTIIVLALLGHFFWALS